MTLSKRVSHWVFGNVWLKLLSLGLALLLWMVVSGEEMVERGLRVPLELTQVPAGVELLGDVPTTVDVRVRGASGTLSRVGPGDVVAVIDLHTVRPGRRLFPLTPEQVRVPFGVEIMQVLPSTVTMAFEPSASRDVPVMPAVEGRPAPGYVVGRVNWTSYLLRASVCTARCGQHEVAPRRAPLRLRRHRLAEQRVGHLHR